MQPHPAPLSYISLYTYKFSSSTAFTASHKLRYAEIFQFHLWFLLWLSCSSMCHHHVWWHTPAISAFGMLRQEDHKKFEASLNHIEFKASLCYTARHCLIKNQKRKKFNNYIKFLSYLTIQFPFKALDLDKSIILYYECQILYI
jgi:hypothetical protein